MKLIKLLILSFGAGLGLNLIETKPVQAAFFTWDFYGYDDSIKGDGYLKFDNSALNKMGDQSPFNNRGINRVKLSELASIPGINLQFGFDLQDTAIFINNSIPINFFANGDPEFTFEFVDELGYLTGIDYTDSQPISMSDCSYEYCSIFTGNFLTTWTGNQFVNRGMGQMDTYQEQLVHIFDPETGKLKSEWQPVLIDSRIGNFVFGEPEGKIKFSTLEAVANPEPLTIIGSGTAIAFGAFFKNHLAKNKNKK